jgi:hypothetical protein
MRRRPSGLQILFFKEVKEYSHQNFSQKKRRKWRIEEADGKI